MNTDKKITVRVYGLCINEHNHILITDEKVGKFNFSKFPGGGLEFGEGTRDCLLREFMEEFNVSITVGEHFYTTDFFQPSAWNAHQQILSIYYLVHLQGQHKFITSEQVQPLNDALYEDQIARFVPINNNLLNQLTLPIDQIVADKLISLYGQR